MEGKDLFEYFKERNLDISEERVKEISFQIAKGILYLHDYGILHRDLKLDNIMMTNKSDQSKPKIVDFGLAKLLASKQKTTESFGTIGYVSPEILLNKSYSYSADLWSLGIIIYALCCGYFPFDHNDDQIAMKLTIEYEIEFDEDWARISKDCKDLVSKLLTKDPEKRIDIKGVLNHRWYKN